MAATNDILTPEFYRHLRTAVMGYFLHRRSVMVEDLADETMVRVTEKLTTGGLIRDVRAYAFGVARNVDRESAREPRAVPFTAELESICVSEQQDKEILDECCTECLNRLSASERRIIILYYSGTGQSLIENRRQLAEKLGLTVDALRIRAHRTRRQLRQCIEECVERDQSI